jgi:hypothetical protein
VSDDPIFRAVWLISLLLMVLAAMVPLARSRRQWLRYAAWWVLIGGFLFAALPGRRMAAVTALKGAVSASTGRRLR